MTDVRAGVEYLKPPATESPATPAEVSERVEQILSDIEANGESAVRRWSREFDHWDPASFLVGPADVERARDFVPTELKDHIAFAQREVGRFAAAQRASMTDVELDMGDGTVLGHRHIPVETVGAYVPGGRYPMLASSFMTVLVAKEAGVDRVIACGPPRGAAGMDPAMLWAIHTSGADAVVCLGGVQALAALAFGLIEDLPPVDMLVGAGNAYVAEAKRQLFGQVGIDLLAGPTEILVVADSTADPELVAADLLGQAEHGPTSPAGLIAIGRGIGEQVLRSVEQTLPTWPTRDIAGAAWDAHGWVAVVADDDAAIALADEMASEHLEIQVEDDKLPGYLERLKNYGSLFLGREATVAYGDKAVGTNHVLPTRRGARYTGGLWVGKFLKTCTYQQLTPEATRRVAPAVVAISEAEGFAGHALTAQMRLEHAWTAGR
jgi:sulfopropanediol 3-dehydrogenase